MFTPEDWERINLDSEKYFKRDDRGILDDIKNGASNAATSAGNTISNAATSAGNTISNAYNSVGETASSIYNGAGNTITQGVNKVNDTWTEIKGQYIEIKEKMDTMMKILKMLPWIIGGLFLFFLIVGIILFVFILKHHNTKKRRKTQRIENLTAAVNNLTKIYCRHNNIDYNDDVEVLQLKVDDDSYEKEE